MPSDDEASMTNRGHILQQLGFFQDTSHEKSVHVFTEKLISQI